VVQRGLASASQAVFRAPRTKVDIIEKRIGALERAAKTACGAETDLRAANGQR
jgi:hypothetical protein